MVGDCIIGPNSCNHCTATITVAKDRKVLKFPRDRIYEEVWVLQIEKVLQTATRSAMDMWFPSIRFKCSFCGARYQRIYFYIGEARYLSCWISLHLFASLTGEKVWWNVMGGWSFFSRTEKMQRTAFPDFQTQCIMLSRTYNTCDAPVAKRAT